MTDEQLVARCRTGDADAWRGLVDRFSRYVWAIAVQGHRLSPADAEEVVQEAFTRVYLNLHRLRSDEAIRPWLGQLTRRLCIDRIRAGKRLEFREEGVVEGVAEDKLEQVELAMDLRGALSELSDDCQAILDRFYLRDQSYEAMSADLGIPAGTIASRLSRCLGRLRDAFARRELTAS